MRGAALFVAGVVFGAALVQSGVAQDAGVRGLNHIGISVRNYDDALAFYTRTMGFREAYTIRRPDGAPQLTYLQLNRDTFVELIPAGPNQPTGITHFGIEVGDLSATVAQFRQRGAIVGEPGLTPAKALFTRMTDPDGVQIEVMEFGSESLQRKAMDAWK